MFKQLYYVQFQQYFLLKNRKTQEQNRIHIQKLSYLFYGETEEYKTRQSGLTSSSLRTERRKP